MSSTFPVVTNPVLKWMIGSRQRRKCRPRKKNDWRRTEDELTKTHFLAAIGLLCGCAFAAQSPRPNFTGTWKLNIPKSTQGGKSVQDVAPNLVYSQTVTQSENSITVETKSDTGPNSLDGTFPINGKYRIEKNGKAYRYTKVGWEGATLVFEISDRDSKKDTAKYLMYTREAWILSPDGKVLTEFRQTSAPLERKTTDQKYMLDKQ